ncbi:U-box domain-containing protein 26-like isoform X1 [Nymphaea colorata]|uniref:U-box domain-containing protein n=2 Tax=Nymphaea colorata TaxID=210225 RepID=A0A5K0UTY6_9MAGN|nr:U-box domain-containing protein 26-like isoform X1 [Nymphaea colorata]
MSLIDDFHMRIPHLYRCPISLDLFSDPVTLSTGQTYDRSSIEKWFADGNDTCPVTMQRLRDFTMVPNRTLRHLIDNWLLMEAQLDPQCQEVIGPHASIGSLKFNLQSVEAAPSLKLDTLRKIRALTKESDMRRSCFVQLDFLPLLLQLVFQVPEPRNELKCEDLELAEEGLCCILNLLKPPCTDKFAALNMMKSSACLNPLLNLLEQGGTKIKMSVCQLVEAITSFPQTQGLNLILGKTERLVRGLVRLLQCRKHISLSNAALRAVRGLCSLNSNHEDIIRAGAMDGLIASIQEDDKRITSCALTTIEVLSIHDSGKRALVDNEKAVPVLVKMLFRVSDSGGSEIAVGLLLDVCQNSPQAQETAIRAGAVTQILLLLQSQCSFRAKSKARMLLKLLRSMWTEDPCMYGAQYGVVES